MIRRISRCICFILLLSCMWTTVYAADDKEQFTPYSIVSIFVSIYTRKCTTHLQQHYATESSATMYHFHGG